MTALLRSPTKLLQGARVGKQRVDPLPAFPPLPTDIQGKAPHVLNNRNTGLTRASRDDGSSATSIRPLT
jgi:hypothetical protein